MDRIRIKKGLDVVANGQVIKGLKELDSWTQCTE